MSKQLDIYESVKTEFLRRCRRLLASDGRNDLFYSGKRELKVKIDDRELTIRLYGSELNIMVFPGALVYSTQNPMDRSRDYYPVGEFIEATVLPPLRRHMLLDDLGGV
jgi:hypothetical protein